MCYHGADDEYSMSGAATVVAQAYSTEYGMEYGYDIEAGYLDNESSFRHEELVQVISRCCIPVCMNGMQIPLRLKS